MAFHSPIPQHYEPQIDPRMEREGMQGRGPSIAQLQQQLQQHQQRQALIDQMVRTMRHNRGLEQVYRLAVHGLVQTLQVSRGLLILFKYADPRYRHSTVGSVARTKASVVIESWLSENFCAIDSSSSDSSSDKRDFETANSDPEQLVTFWASDCSLCQAILTGQPQVLFNEQPGERSGLAQQAASLFRLNALPTLLMLPLESQNTILGCLVLQHETHQDWSIDTVDFVRLIAAQLSTAILQTRSFQQVQAVVQERTAQLQRSLEVQAKLYEKSRQQVEQLRKLNAEREEFLSTISHELLTPLTSMTLAIRMLRQAKLDDARRQKYLDILEQQCVQETHLINDLLALRKLDSVPTSVQAQKLDLRQLILTLTEAMGSTWQDKDLKLDLDLPPRPLIFYSDGDNLHRILMELLTNAKKYSEPGSTIHLRLTYEGDITARQVTMVVRNIGVGIPPDELPHIFDKFRRGQGMTQQAVPGTGLGLALVKSLVEHMEGTITAASRPLDHSAIWETSFTITLPQAKDGCIHASA
ncbi:GAF domain-containing sensor histidine kinase [Leptolyngbya sp. NK1-12]|uniref:histidine kinase n=1 Tax=Leptolyngbya sp. NK1-12 TaxID=2547451 RepID=A0AA96WFG5_9CYAN|nr:GAF domain-containing sensor histidine kinase [Leptolyngbya sp. NK1-12]WNZ24259.1 GAF domain-containing sensor histidine kinase [Leptolyngbya sp. NK1-12]